MADGLSVWVPVRLGRLWYPAVCVPGTERRRVVNLAGFRTEAACRAVCAERNADWAARAVSPAWRFRRVFTPGKVA